MATESPTRIMSTPASSATRALGASYAVTITSGSAPLRTLRFRTAGTVMGAREAAGEDDVELMRASLWIRPVPFGYRRCTYGRTRATRRSIPRAAVRHTEEEVEVTLPIGPSGGAVPSPTMRGRRTTGGRR